MIGRGSVGGKHIESNLRHFERKPLNDKQQLARDAHRKDGFYFQQK